MIVRAAVVAHPPRPLPVPAAGAAPEVCTAATLLTCAAPNRAGRGPRSAGTFPGFGTAVATRFGTVATGARDLVMPLPALVPGWLREHTAAQSVTVVHPVGPTE